MTTLVKIDSKDAIRVLNIWTDGAFVKRSAGVLGGKLVESDKECKPKNVGRSNETTATAQAISEAQSEVNKKLDETYVLVDEIDVAHGTFDEIKAWIKSQQKSIPQAMLAKTYDPKYADYENGVLVSPKLDGMRCLSPEGELWSRGSKAIETMAHIAKELDYLRKATDFQGTLDGELYYHDKESENFQSIMKACKKYRKGISEKAEYWVYDMVDPNMTAIERYNYYAPFVKNGGGGYIQLVPQYLVHSEEEVKRLHKQFLAEGYEGTMIKNAQSKYREDARSSDLLKMKDFQDAEYKVVDIEPMKNKPEFGIAVLESEGKLFRATPKMSHEDRRQLLLDREQYIGGVATVTFFSKTDEGLPRFPVLKAITKPGDLEDFRIAS